VIALQRQIDTLTFNRLRFVPKQCLGGNCGLVTGTLCLRLTCDNDIYSSHEVSLDELMLIGRVVGCLSHL